MLDFSTLIQQGAANAWLFIPSAIFLGALHGLEPGHSKTMMAAFIVAIRGTVGQAVLLGLAATLSHTAIVWIIALIGLQLGQGYNAEANEPYFQIGSAAMILAVALWMVWRTWREQQTISQEADHDHHGHGPESRVIDTGHGIVTLEIFEQGVPPRWHISTEQGHKPSAQNVTVITTRPDGARQAFAFRDCGGYLESVDEIPEPHEFEARLSLGHGDHVHDFDVVFIEHHHQGHDHQGLDVSDGEWQDAHERAHANDIKRRFANQNVTTGQIIMFGLTGGLIPCPASITVLLLCLQLKEFTLGVVLVLCFSIGLALTMVASGALAALSVRHVSRRWSGFGAFARRAPYFSSALIILVGLYVGWQGVSALG